MVCKLLYFHILSIAKETTKYTREGLETLKEALSKDLTIRPSENQQSDNKLLENNGVVFKQNSTPTKNVSALRSQVMQEKAVKLKRGLISSVKEKPELTSSY